MTIKSIARLAVVALVFVLVFWLGAGHAFAQGLQQRAFGHIDRAIHEVSEAIQIVAAHS